MKTDPGSYFVAIGASGGEGLNDIKHVLAALPRNTPAVVMVVLHRPSDKVSALREVLARAANMPVVIATEAEQLDQGVCYIGGPASHLTLLSGDAAGLVSGGNHRLRGRTIDILFNSLARHAGKRAIGVVLSGSLDDGSRGLAAIHDAGGLTMVLDPEEKPRGMQQNAIDFDGPISFIGTAAEIAATIEGVLKNDGRAPKPP